MNRKRYVIDKSYREGYDEGRKNGMDEVINTYTAYLNRLEENTNYLLEKLKNIRAKSEEV